MRDVKIAFEARECRSMQGKVIPGKVRVYVDGGEEVFPKEHASEMLKKHLLDHLRYEVAIVKVGDEVRVVIKHGSGCSVFRPLISGDGSVGAVCTSYSGMGFKEEVDATTMHLAQQAATNYDDVPPWLPVSKVSDYQWWCQAQKEFLRQKAQAEA